MRILRAALERYRASAVLVLLLAGAGAPAEMASATDNRVWVGIEQPTEGQVRRSNVPLMRVSGWTGSFKQGWLDVAIAIDVSYSTQNGSGVDVNGDGHAGGLGWRRRRSLWGFLRRPHLSSDPGDSILHAEVEAVRGLTDALDASRTRVGIVTFSEEAQVRSIIGSTGARIDGALDFISGLEPRGRTNFAAAIETATELLVEAKHASEGRELAILLLSDDFPTVPPPAEFAASKAVLAARAAARHRIRIYSFALGVEPGTEGFDSLALREVARVTRGVYMALQEPGDVIEVLPRIDLTGLAEIRIRNRTTGEDARAVWVRPDGTFGGFVVLKKGRNVLRVTATGPNGGEAAQDRVVFFRPSSRRSKEDLRELEALREQIEEIRVERDLVLRMEERRERRPSREVDVDVERADRD
jgi:hypothetical protein